MITGNKTKSILFPLIKKVYYETKTGDFQLTPIVKSTIIKECIKELCVIEMANSESIEDNIKTIIEYSVQLEYYIDKYQSEVIINTIPSTEEGDP